jgi:pimeloyl-ACP methyl ester carboxylesterase
LCQELTAAGHQCLLIDLYGRGYSDGVDDKHPYVVGLFTTQIAEVLLHLNALTNGRSTSAIHLIGTSMGGAVSVRFAQLHPTLVKSLTVACPAGLPWQMPGIAKVVKWPGIGEMLMSMASKSATAKNTAKAYHDHTVEGAKQHWEATVERTERLGKLHPGFGPGFLSTVRNFEMHALEESYAEVGNSGLPILLLWGQEDVVVPFATHQLALKYFPNATFVPLEHCGHVDFFCVPAIQEQFHKAVVAHLSKADIAASSAGSDPAV